MRKLSIEEVREEFSSRGYELLETDYVNTDKKMKYRCPKHPDKDIEISLSKLKSGRGCAYCGGRGKLYLTDVQKAFKERGYELLAGEYVNDRTKMPYRCPKHPDKELTIHYCNLRSGHGCPYCAGTVKFTLNEVRKEFADRGYELLATEYKNNLQKLPYRCPSHPDKELSISLANVRKAGCPYCAFSAHAERQTGEGNHNWKGGVTELNFYLRQSLDEWKKMALSNSDYRCFITGAKGKLDIHHIKSYNQVRDEVLSKLGYPLHRTVGEYTKEQFESIITEFAKAHYDIEGVPIKKRIHELFHKHYGNDVNDRDLLEFRDRYLKGEFAA